MTNLYDTSEQYQALTNMLDDTESEITQEAINTTLELVADDFKNKGVSICYVVENNNADIKALSAHIKKMQDIKKRKQKFIDNLKTYLKTNMEKCGIQKIESPLINARVQASPPSVEIIDMNQVPDKFKIIKTEVQADKKAILEAGGCMGVKIVQSNHLRIC